MSDMHHQSHAPKTPSAHRAPRGDDVRSLSRKPSAIHPSKGRGWISDVTLKHSVLRCAHIANVEGCPCRPRQRHSAAPSLKNEIDRIARRSRRSFSEVTQDLWRKPADARVPGVYFADEPAGREARWLGRARRLGVIRDYLAARQDERRSARPLLSLFRGPDPRLPPYSQVPGKSIP